MSRPSASLHDDVVLTLGERLTQLQPRVSIVGLAGFAFTGKTTLASTLVTLWHNDEALLLPVEGSILARSERLAAGVDGCQPEAYDMTTLRETVATLNRMRSVDVPVYSWHDGDTAGRERMRVGEHALVVVDGSVCCESPVRESCIDTSVLFGAMTEQNPLAEAITTRTTVKIVVTVPESHVDAVRKAMGDAGAGVIGKYSHCSVTFPIEGRFKPEPGADPHIGEVGEMQVVHEFQVETQCDAAIARKVIEALCKAHPYEEPAYDIYPLFGIDDLP